MPQGVERPKGADGVGCGLRVQGRGVWFPVGEEHGLRYHYALILFVEEFAQCSTAPALIPFLHDVLQLLELVELLHEVVLGVVDVDQFVILINI